MALGEALLDSFLAFEQPVHRLVQVVFVVVADPERLGQRRGVPKPRGGELRGGVQQPFEHHRHHPVALRAALRADESLQPQAPAKGEQRFDVTVRHGTLDHEGVLGGEELLALQDPTKRLDLLCGPVGEVRQGFLAHPFALAPALAKEDRGARVAVGDSLDVHGNKNSILNPLHQHTYPDIHGNKKHPLHSIFSIYINDLSSI